MFDYVVVGAGLAGCVMAERIANVLNKNVLILEKRDHIGGNCYDYYNEDGILVHKYGPHILHTELEHVWEYLSAFTDWNEYQHKVLGFIDGNKIPIPFNLNSLNETFPASEGQQLEEKLLNKYGYGVKISISDLQRSDDIELRPLVSYVYNKVFLNYTIKQWGMGPEELDPSVISRVPVLLSRDDHYFQDHYQGLPRDGYFKMFERMISSPKIKIKLNTDYKEILEFQDGVIKFLGDNFHGKLVFTGEIDYFFDYEFGKLPYRSLNFKMETLDQEFFQKLQP
jgi:UDP-galactopyranose mutase